MNTQQHMLIALCSLALGLQTSQASSLLECQDAGLADFDTQQMIDSLRSVGGEDCNLQSHSWGDAVSCERTHARAFGLPVKELSAEIHQSGLRTLMLVTSASDATSRKMLRDTKPAAGLQLEVQAREDGTSTVRCLAGAAETPALVGAITGVVPELPPGASGWSICAQPATGTPTCAETSSDGSYRIDGLAPGEYGLIATPQGAIDPLLRAMLIRAEPVGINAEGGPKVLAERINVRSGAASQAGELKLLRLPPAK